MKIARNIGLILFGIAIWIAGFIFISIPAIDEWNDCWTMNRLDGGRGLAFIAMCTKVIMVAIAAMTRWLVQRLMLIAQK